MDLTFTFSYFLTMSGVLVTDSSRGALGSKPVSSGPVRQPLCQPARILRGPSVAAADSAGHAVTIVLAVDVVPGNIPAERAGQPEDLASALALVAVQARHALALGACLSLGLARRGHRERPVRHRPHLNYTRLV